MPSFDIGPTRAVGALENRLAREARGQAMPQPRAAVPEGPVASAPMAAGQPPINAERVAEIRKAVENGTYPVLPAKVADAMIAAGMILRVGK
jgi:negative regulator of flagellin synthesis FlgM